MRSFRLPASVIRGYWCPTEDDWRAIQETLYLTSVPGMKDSIVEGLWTPLEQCTKELDW